MTWFDRMMKDVSDAELLNEALRDWQDSHGQWRVACRNYARVLLRRMKRSRDAGRAELHAAYLRTMERRAAE
jgi:hypothetical protein